jgi:hypothetical protein
MTIQIPNFHISDKSKIIGSGQVPLLPNRKDASHTGVFGVKVDVSFDPALDNYPVGTVRIDVDLSDAFKGKVDSTSIEQVNSFGKHTPTSVITGRCLVTLATSGTAPAGCRFWLLIANNKKSSQQGTADVVGFVVYDRSGNRVGYGTGALDGDIEISGFGL